MSFKEFRDSVEDDAAPKAILAFAAAAAGFSMILFAVLG